LTGFLGFIQNHNRQIASLPKLGMSSSGKVPTYHGGSKNPDKKKIDDFLDELDASFPAENPSPPPPPPSNDSRSQQPPSPPVPPPSRT
jgi:hypothetical protein